MATNANTHHMVSECQSLPVLPLTAKPDKSLARPGVYAIFCEANGRYYVGSSINIKKRMTQHFSGLSSNRHFSRHLQAAFNKHGEDKFRFEVLEFTGPGKEEIIGAERRWIAKKDSCKSGFNVMPDANSPLGVIHTQETIEKMVAAAKRRGKNPHAKGNSSYELISPSGEIVKGFNMAEFCRENGFSPNDSVNFLALNRGRISTYKGWMSPKMKPVGKSLGGAVEFSLMSPSGEIHSGKNVAEFCRSIGKQPNYFSDLIYSGRGGHGWNIAPGFVFERKKKKTRIIISPSGETHVFGCIKDFAALHNLKPKGLQHFLSSSDKQYLGWRKPPCS